MDKMQSANHSSIHFLKWKHLIHENWHIVRSTDRFFAVYIFHSVKSPDTLHKYSTMNSTNSIMH